MTDPMTDPITDPMTDPCYPPVGRSAIVAVADGAAPLVVTCLAPVTPAVAAAKSDVSTDDVGAPTPPDWSARSVEPTGGVAVTAAPDATTVTPNRLTPVVVTDGADCAVPVAAFVPVALASIGLAVLTPEYALIEPDALTDCDSANDHEAGSAAATTCRHVVSPTPGTAFEVTAVQPAGAVTVVGAPVLPPPLPVVTETSSTYHGEAFVFCNATCTMAVPTGVVYEAVHEVNAVGDNVIFVVVALPSDAQVELKYCT
jgi:hypothetical protein